jgi:hypothetical protein
VGAGGHPPGVGRGDRPVREGLGGGGPGAAEQRPGGPDRAAGGPGAHAEPVAQPAGGRGGLDVLVGAGRPAGIDRGQFLEPVAFQAVQQPPELEDPFGRDGVG